MNAITSADILFTIADVFGVRVRTTKSYFHKITTLKHSELQIETKDITSALSMPDEVRLSVQDETIKLFYKNETNSDRALVIVVKYLTIDEGFVVTIYETTNPNRKGKILWQNQK